MAKCPKLFAPFENAAPAAPVSTARRLGRQPGQHEGPGQDSLQCSFDDDLIRIALGHQADVQFRH